jgi:hypothetical protein
MGGEKGVGALTLRVEWRRGPVLAKADATVGAFLISVAAAAATGLLSVAAAPAPSTLDVDDVLSVLAVAASLTFSILRVFYQLFERDNRFCSRVADVKSQ